MIIKKKGEAGSAMSLVLIFVTIVGLAIASLIFVTQLSTNGVRQLSESNNNSSKSPSIATLIRDGYLMDHEAEDTRQVNRAKMEWMDEYAAYLLDTINND